MFLSVCICLLSVRPWFCFSDQSSVQRNQSENKQAVFDVQENEPASDERTTTCDMIRNTMCRKKIITSIH